MHDVYYLNEEKFLKEYKHESPENDISKAFTMYSDRFDLSNPSKLDADRIKSHIFITFYHYNTQFSHLLRFLYLTELLSGNRKFHI